MSKLALNYFIWAFVLSMALYPSTQTFAAGSARATRTFISEEAAPAPAPEKPKEEAVKKECPPETTPGSPETPKAKPVEAPK